METTARPPADRLKLSCRGGGHAADDVVFELEYLARHVPALRNELLSLAEEVDQVGQRLRSLERSWDFSAADR